MGKKLYVGNLPFTATEHHLNETFAQIGTVASSKIVTDIETGRSKGFGYVEMSSESEARSAISIFDGAEYDGRPLKVKEAPSEAPNQGWGEIPFLIHDDLVCSLSLFCF